MRFSQKNIINSRINIQEIEHGGGKYSRNSKMSQEMTNTSKDGFRVSVVNSKSCVNNARRKSDSFD